MDPLDSSDTCQNSPGQSKSNKVKYWSTKSCFNLVKLVKETPPSSRLYLHQPFGGFFVGGVDWDGRSVIGEAGEGSGTSNGGVGIPGDGQNRPGEAALTAQLPKAKQSVRCGFLA